jgi:hypothetical protein
LHCALHTLSIKFNIKRSLAKKPDFYTEAVMLLLSLLKVKNQNSEVASYEMILICLKTD